MNKLLVGIAAAAFVVAVGGTAFAKTETIQGKIVDEACYKMDKANTGAELASKAARTIRVRCILCMSNALPFAYHPA